MNDNNYIDELISKYWFLTNDIKNKNIYYPLEGYLFPDTYNVMKDTDRFRRQPDYKERSAIPKIQRQTRLPEVCQWENHREGKKERYFCFAEEIKAGFHIRKKQYSSDSSI